MATLFEKIWKNHVVTELGDGRVLLYIDLHLVHEVTSPQAFEGLRLAGRKVRRPDKTFATMDHNVPTKDRKKISDAIAGAQMAALETNCREFEIPLYGLDDARQGIVHVIGPELGLTCPGMTIVCGDSHTSTHGAFGALAFGIGTSEVEHVLATQCLIQNKPKTLEAHFKGDLPPGVSPKDLILKLIGILGTAGATGYVVEYSGSLIKKCSMEGRMTICNMSIEAGARAGMIAPDETTLAYITALDREFAPRGKDLEHRTKTWKELHTDLQRDFDRRVEISVDHLAPQVTWGTSPGMVADITGTVPEPTDLKTVDVQDARRALAYMDLKPGMRLQDIPIDVVFLGSCTNSRIEDLRQAANILKGKKIAEGVQVLVVPGSQAVKRMAESEGLHQIFLSSGCEWRDSGCSMCLGMNPDQLNPGQRAASTTNRNFEGRQGKGGRTHLVSPETAAATALKGKLTDPRNYI